MFVDLAEEQLDLAKADVCIVGSGAAGITLALELAKSGLHVVVIESGGDLAEHANRTSYKLLPGKKIQMVNDETKPSYFGGNTNYWFGNCRPLEREDFEQREWLPYSGWPIGLDELKPYYERALSVAGVGGFHLYDLEISGPLLPDKTADVSAGVLETKIDQTTPVFKFADLYRQDLAAAESVQVLLGAHVLQLKTNDIGDRIVEAEAAGRNGGRSLIRADTFVLAAGGVENARLLLCSNDTRPAGLGNESDLVGRFFMDHLYFAFAPWESGLDNSKSRSSLRLYDAGATGNREAAFERHFEIEGSRVFPKLAMSAEWMERERVPGMNVWIRPGRRAPKSLKTLKRLVVSLPKGSLPTLSDFREVVRDPFGSLRFLLWRLTGRFQPPQDYEFIAQIEQKPDPENRIRLSARLDRFGQPEAELLLALDEEQRRQHARSLKAAADELGLNGDELASALEQKYNAGEFDFIFHHTGTTRMNDDPAQGVVDRNCRVHGIANLFVAGSSVFPTAGTAPPTLTIIALAIRLAERIQAISRRGSEGFDSRNSFEP